MNIELNNMSTRRASGQQGEHIISLATLAVGGQGGGVLTNWIVAVAEANGYVAQSTSVAGVAQRTGATIYYVEMCKDTGAAPVFTLSPAEKDVDIVIASELMEAGRAVLRGLSSPEFTTLIASTHRIAAIGEKMVPGDGRVGPEEVLEAMSASAEKVIAFDMEGIAATSGTMISASLLGALAGSGALPFPRESYEQVITASGRGVDASLRAFSISFSEAGKEQGIVLPDASEVAAADGVKTPAGSDRLIEEWRALKERVESFPTAARTMIRLGLQKVVDYQDTAYGSEFLDHLSTLEKLNNGELLNVGAKYIAKAMCYDDIIRVADLKTSASRLARVEGEIGLKPDQVVHLTEYFHPRFEEIYLSLPENLGRRVQNSARLRRFFERRLAKGRRLRTNTLRGFVSLWLVAGLRPWRRKLMRHGVEMRHMQEWLAKVHQVARTDQALAIEILTCHRLIKGYSDTHLRGMSKFDKVMVAADSLSGREDTADWVRRLRVAALEDADGRQLEDALKTVRSFL